MAISVKRVEASLRKMAVLEVEGLNSRTFSGASGFRVDFIRDWKRSAARWNDAAQGTSFQHDHWLDAWYGAFDTITPLIAIISDAATRRKLALVPLIRRVQRGVRIVEFADLGLTDYNAPILDCEAPADAAGARVLCQALLAALRRLPDGVDLIRLQKMPADVGGKPNPLVSLGSVGSCSLNGNLIQIGDDFDVYRASIKRMQLPRSWRVFNRFPGATFRIIANVDEALTLLDVMDAQQQARMHRLGQEFILNDEVRGKFYRDLVIRGVREGYVIVSALTCDEGIVATLLGVRQGENCVFLRISNAGRRWSHCSPSRLVIERTMAALHKVGVRNFDLSIGNYAFKRRFGAVQLPLTDVSIALGWRGIPYVLRDRAAQWLRGHPWLAERVERALGKPRREDKCVHIAASPGFGSPGQASIARKILTWKR
jgi:CelD/BcsL family acetyltransferase involved in cellulose biosynthesis